MWKCISLNALFRNRRIEKENKVSKPIKSKNNVD